MTTKACQQKRSSSVTQLAKPPNKTTFTPEVVVMSLVHSIAVLSFLMVVSNATSTEYRTVRRMACAALAGNAGPTTSPMECLVYHKKTGTGCDEIDVATCKCCDGGVQASAYHAGIYVTGKKAFTVILLQHRVEHFEDHWEHMFSQLQEHLLLSLDLKDSF